jgi:2-polyprenyl-3-methyl-5-hydroxy-6-metoxy-1,4-benzoquinol methylase
VLDWGGDTGMNSLFRERNRLLHIHDISGVGLVPGAECVELEHIGQNQYDLVSCNQVLEHIPFPLEFVEQILPAIGPQTLFYLEVPNETLMRQNSGNPGLASLKRHWHEHVNFFTEASIRRLLKRLDLEIVDVLHLPINLGGVHGQIMGVLTRRC